MSTARRIYLIGMPCCGKTTLGRALAAATGVLFIDLDEAIEARAGCSVTEIFSRHGQSAFRKMESEALAELASKEGPIVVACGGGAPCHASNMELMSRTGTTVFLQAERRKLVDRLVLYGATRPLVAGKDRHAIETYVDDTQKARLPYYTQAARTFDSSQLDCAAEVEATTEKFCREFLPELTFDVAALKKHLKS